MNVQGLIGKKIGMTQLFQDNGTLIGVTVIQAGPCTVTQVRTPARDGHQAVQLGYQETGRVSVKDGQTLKRALGNRSVRPLSLPEAGHLKGVGRLFRHLREFPLEDLGTVQIGQDLDASIFQVGDQVDITGTSKGRGFAGVVKRHHFKGGPKTHGQSDRHRAPGSIGATTYAGRVFKGLKMAGHYGNERVTTQNLEVVRVEPERSLLFVWGAVPGPSKGLLLIRKAVKRQGN